MTDSIQLWFDFSSPYGYLGFSRLDEIEKETGKTVSLHPYLMGALFKTTGRQPLKEHPMVWQYAQKDAARAARKLGVEIVLPDPFPVATAGACRVFYWIQQTAGDDKARVFAEALYQAYFCDNRNISDKSIVAEIAEACGHDREQALSATNMPEIKEKLRNVIEEAADRGIFGSPFLCIDDEPFWGVDHIDDAIRWARDGAW